MRDWLADVFRGRPTWMNVVLVFSAYMTFVYVPWDLLWKPAAHDEEVWFGILFTGGWAKLMAIPHWAVYGALTYGLRRMRPWTRTLGALYAAQVALGMFVWNLSNLDGILLPLFVGTVGALPFGLLALAFFSSEDFDRPRPSLRDRYAPDGEWAIVTGASAGIGAEFARAIARDGVHLVLTARRGERLREIASELEKQCSISTRVVEVDLAKPKGAERLLEAVSDLEIGILVNNAGVGYAGRFDKQQPERLRQLVHLNCTAPVLLTAQLLPAMRARGRGAVIFTGSVAGAQPLPLHATYSASKSFDNFMGEALYVELRGSGVDVLALEPGSTQSEFHDVAGELPHPGEPAAQVVEVALDALGNQPSVVSGWLNYLRATLGTRLLPRPLLLYVARDVIAQQTPEDMR